ncbi:MAG: D-2-hydroxyacid dehydrogenase [Ilumatobacter sp.]|nr:MAG: D-2-hydroxyacid dehydrogenase [Ilumatobacter sp.]
MSDPDAATSESRPPVLFCTDTLWEVRGDEITTALPGIDVVTLIGTDHVPAEQLERVTIACFSGDAWPDRSANFMQACIQSPNLEWLHTFSAGVDHPVFQSFMARGVTVTTSSGSSASPIAQTVMMYLLALTRDLPGWLRAQAEHRWEARGIRELDGLTIGVVGMGPIGQEIARLGQAFGMHAIGMRRTVTGDEPCETWTFDRLHELAGAVDVLALAVPLTEETRGLVDASVFAAMRPGSLFVNIARGEVVDEPALIEALRTGHLAGAGLDVFTNEPLEAESPLWDMPDVIITPHSSGTTQRSNERATDIFVDNLARRAAGQPLRNTA